MTNMDVWSVNLELAKPLFELKLARFGYRYKYEDGEYSAFSPWSELAFMPGKFKYSAKKAFNLGMVNNVRELKIQNYLPYPRPLDIKEVDILYKTTDSPSVYVAHTIKRNEDYELAWNYDGMDEDDINTNVMKTGSFTITSEMIHKLLPENQTLRAWDNVPRYALAQEIIGNRLLFGNYVQGYNMEYPVGLSQSIFSDETATIINPKKSIKSIRSYKFGMVFGDKYGRETPVIESGYLSGSGELTTTATGDLTVSKLLSSMRNSFELTQKWGNQLFPNATPLDWMSYIKYYVKETSNEYYNLIMDRWYWANQFNSHLWLSFPSSDRNKVDMETHMILKNKHGYHIPVPEKARYKIIDIKNDVPTYVSTRKIDLGEMEISCGTTFSTIWPNQGVCVDNDFQDINNSYPPLNLESETKISIMLAGFNQMLGGLTGDLGTAASGESGVGAFDPSLFGRKLKGELWFRVKGWLSTGANQATYKTQWKRVTHQRVIADDWDGAYGNIYYDSNEDGVVDYDDEPVGYMNALQIHWDEPFGDEVDMRQLFIDAVFPTTYDADFDNIDVAIEDGGNGGDGNQLDQDLRYYLEFREHAVEHKPEYEGRFFVKIESDENILSHIVESDLEDPAAAVEENYTVVASFPYNFIATNVAADGDSYDLYNLLFADEQGDEVDGLYTDVPAYMLLTESGLAGVGVNFSGFLNANDPYWENDSDDNLSFAECYANNNEGQVGPNGFWNSKCLTGSEVQGVGGFAALSNTSGTGIAPTPINCSWERILNGTISFWINWRNWQGGANYGLIDADEEIYRHVTFIDGARAAYGGYNSPPNYYQNNSTWRGGGSSSYPHFWTIMPESLSKGLGDGVGWEQTYNEPAGNTKGCITFSYLGSNPLQQNNPEQLKGYLTDTGTIFRFQDDPGVIYRVIGNHFVEYSTDYGLYSAAVANNAMNVGADGALHNFHVGGIISDVQTEGTNYYDSGCKICPAGNGPVYPYDSTTLTMSTETGLTPPCDRFSYQVEFRKVDPLTNDTTEYGMDTFNFDPRSRLIQTGDSENRTIQILAYNPTTTDNEDGDETSEGACWETEPKEDVGLDIYHEASSAIPLILNDENCYDFAPISSPISLSRRPSEDTASTTIDNQEINVSLNWETYLFARYFRGQQSPDFSGPIIGIKRKITDNNNDNEVAFDELNYPTYYSGIDVWSSTISTRIGINDFIFFTHGDGETKTKTKVVDYYEPMPNINIGSTVNLNFPGENNTLNINLDSNNIGETHQHTRWRRAIRKKFAIAKTTSATGLVSYYINADDGQVQAKIGDFIENISMSTYIDGSPINGFLNGLFITNINEEQTLDITQGGVVIDTFWKFEFECAGTSLLFDSTIEEDWTDFDGIYIGSQGIAYATVVTPTGYYQIDGEVYKYPIKLGWFNCYSFGNGVESDRIRDDYNAPTIDNGVKVSSTFSGYREEKMSSGLIYSGLYNSTSQINDLNEFNIAEKITKELNPAYGSIQALKSRDSDVVVLAEDKILKVIANKDAIYNADGNPQLIASNRVLGTAIPFAGDYGISKNPESLAWDQYRLYFTDRQRGSVLRLSRDGLTPVSNVGMQTWFRDNLRKAHTHLGTFDVVSGEYNLTINYNNNETQLDPVTNEQVPIPDTTVSFSEASKGWVGFKSFVPESGKSASGKYFTSKTISIYEHHSKDIETYNNFYGTDYESSVKILFNDVPSVVKSFKTVNYEGSQSRVTQHTNMDNATGLTTISDAAGNIIDDLTDGQYYNLNEKTGWYVNSFETDLQSGKVPEFIEKEGKWFNKINGLTTTIDNLDQSELTVQGLGMPAAIDVPSDGEGLDIFNGQFTLSNYSPGQSNEYSENENIADSIAEEIGPIII